MTLNLTMLRVNGWQLYVWRDDDSVTLIDTGAPGSGTEILGDGDVLDFGGGAEILAIRGHTEGSIAIHLPRHGVLFTGDTIANVSTVMLGVFNQNRVQPLRHFSDWPVSTPTPPASATVSRFLPAPAIEFARWLPHWCRDS